MISSDVGRKDEEKAEERTATKNEKTHLMSKTSQRRRSSNRRRSIERSSHSESIGDVVGEVGDCFRSKPIEPPSVRGSTRLFSLPPRLILPSCKKLTKVQVSSSLCSLPSSSFLLLHFLNIDRDVSSSCINSSTSFPQLPIVRILLHRRALPTRRSTVRVSMGVSPSNSFSVSIFSEGREVSHRLNETNERNESDELVRLVSKERKGTERKREKRVGLRTLSSKKNKANPPKIAHPTRTFLLGSTTTILTSPEG